MNDILHDDKEKISNIRSGYSNSEHESIIYNVEVLEISTHFPLSECFSLDLW